MGGPVGLVDWENKTSEWTESLVLGSSAVQCVILYLLLGVGAVRGPIRAASGEDSEGAAGWGSCVGLGLY